MGDFRWTHHVTAAWNQAARATQHRAGYLAHRRNVLSNIRNSVRTARPSWRNLHVELYVEPRWAVPVSIASNCPYQFLTKDQFISMYFFGPFSMTDFRNMTVRTITTAEEVAKMNINILSSPNVYHSITLPSKKGNSAQTPALPAENTYGQHGGLSMAPALLTGSSW